MNGNSTLPDSVEISCPYQVDVIGGIKCKAAQVTAVRLTEITTPEVCASCQIGRIYRELGCKHISGNVEIVLLRTLGPGADNYILMGQSLWCSLRKRNTSYEHCLSCNLVGSEHTKRTVSETLDLFEASGFESSYRDLEKARAQLIKNPEDSITSSCSSLESTLKTVLDQLNELYPKKEVLTDLWSTVKRKLNLGDEIAEPCLKQVIGSVTGAISGLAGLRNALSDAHGKGLISPEVFESYAELALNLSGTMSTFLIRRLKEIQ